MKKLWVSILFIIPILLWGYNGTVEAAETTETQQITLHKLIFDTVPEEQQNSGDEMSWENAQPLKNAGFTAYDVTKRYWEVYNETTGSQSEKENAANDAVKAIDVTDLPSYAFDLTDANGATTKLLPVISDKQNAVYLFKETTTPAGAIAEKAVDFVVGLPVLNDDGANKENVHLYPKNQYETNDLAFTKYGVAIDDQGNLQAPAVLAGATFILKERDGQYYSSETNRFDADEASAAKFVSNDQGIVHADGLILKDQAVYEFIEIDSSVALQGKQTTDQEVYHYRSNPAVVVHTARDQETSVLKITYDYFDVDQNQVLASDQAEAYNYQVPEPTKTVDDSDVDIDQVFTYTIEQQIPKDIARYSLFQLIDTPDAALTLVSSANEIAASLLINGVSVDPALVEVKTDNELTFTFDPASLIPYQGQTIHLTIKMKLKPDAVLGQAIDNQIELDNDFHPKTDETSVMTYGKTFKKINADTQNPLSGAAFHVKRDDSYLVIEEGKVSWTTQQDQAYTFISGENGEIVVAGLAQKDASGQPITYQLIETKAPEGYVLPKNPWAFQADNGVEVMTVTNKLEGSLPLTGGMGIAGFLAAGLMIIGTAVLYFSKRKQA
ncbi:SpaH/EbpB family LPXTG-anchored major pilin [Enterococcus sp. DIV0876]|uniref:SpaH/EbpB family LPXTG-anchored major pilin n=1 Tax=Enterococcus sp. DIV0876 TaxID=2774633 RepID=UPI003D2FE91A